MDNRHMTCDGLNVLVTGASRGIGRACAVALGRAGARVAAHGFANAERAREVAEMAGNGSQAFLADLSDPHAPGRLVDEVLESFGGLDVVVNNAGVSLEMPLDLDEDAWLSRWEKTMAINVRAVEAISRRAIRHFSARGGGRLIHIASRAAFRGDTPDYVAYAASKGAVVALSRTLARGLGKLGITSFVIAPGWVRTDMAAEFIEKHGEEPVLNEIALPRLTEPEDVAPMVVFLASGLGDHATGTSIDINAASYVR
ncbi:MAG: SDR family oxidoreductase [Rhodothermales bacterium]|nr:SDR family oxidoreductase [Rhodothermales bacterium]MBO6778976.1 SDR family oxidoreductase [Rhodothermales bacterium]